MNTKHFADILAITILSFGTGAMAEGMTQSEYRAAEKRIEADYKSSQKSFDLFATNEKKYCMSEAKRTQKIAMAALVERCKLHTKATSAVLSRLNRDKAWPKKTWS